MQDQRVRLLCVFECLHQHHSCAQRQQLSNSSVLMEQLLRRPLNLRQLTTSWMRRTGFFYSLNEVVALRKRSLSCNENKTRGACIQLDCASFFFDRSITFLTIRVESNRTRWIARLYSFSSIKTVLPRRQYYHLSSNESTLQVVQKRETECFDQVSGRI